MPGLTNNTTLLEADNQLIVSVNELVSSGITVTIDTSSLEAELDQIEQAINNLTLAVQNIDTGNIQATVDLSALIQKLEDTLGTPINPIEASLRASLNLVRDNLDTPGGNLGVAAVLESFNLPLSRIGDNLDVSVTDLFGTLGDFLEFFNIDIPGLPESAGVATILAIIAVELGGLQAAGAPIDFPTLFNNIKTALDTIGTEIDGIGNLTDLANLELIADNIEAHRVTTETQTTAQIVAQNTNFADHNAALAILQEAFGYKP